MQAAAGSITLLTPGSVRFAARRQHRFLYEQRQGSHLWAGRQGDWDDAVVHSRVAAPHCPDWDAHGPAMGDLRLGKGVVWLPDHGRALTNRRPLKGDSAASLALFWLAGLLHRTCIYTISDHVSVIYYRASLNVQMCCSRIRTLLD
jgi:hypothetical protein